MLFSTTIPWVLQPPMDKGRTQARQRADWGTWIFPAHKEHPIQGLLIQEFLYAVKWSIKDIRGYVHRIDVSCPEYGYDYLHQGPERLNLLDIPVAQLYIM